ncbi:MAG: bifunctional 4-hydroxy-2-oxoglutarate aldolase/2-dehydro-3-deoxy-phosphogluconate aldolase [Candidatus Sulfotelmatobacter sp.]
MATELSVEDVIRKIGEIGIIPVVRASSVDEANRAVEAICAGGIPVVEITMTVPNAVAVIRELVQHRAGDVLIGAGTVTNADQAESCLRAGAQFLVSPGLAISVLSVARANAKLAIPGALTPTELMNAQDHGARLVKIFPCGNVGGPKYLKSLKAPFPHASLVPTGGVNATNAAEFIAAGAFALGVGADLVDVVALREGNLEKVSTAARELVNAVSSARASLRSKKAS